MGWTRRKFLKIVAGSVSGTRLASSGEARSGFPPEPQAGSIHEPDAGVPFDVCIIGSGPAGTILACELVRHGIRTLLVEGGQVPSSNPRYKPADYPIERTRFLGVGGTSNLWSGSCPRFQPLDFEPANPYVPADAPWPITYKEIEPYYQRAENELQVHGGLPSRYSPPRASPYPFPLGSEPGFS